MEKDVHIVLEPKEKLLKNLYRKHKKFMEINMIIVKLFMEKTIEIL
jgi:hypothetical protein